MLTNPTKVNELMKKILHCTSNIIRITHFKAALSTQNEKNLLNLEPCIKKPTTIRVFFVQMSKTLIFLLKMFDIELRAWYSSCYIN